MAYRVNRELKAHMDINTTADSELKQRKQKKRKSSFLLTASFFRLETTPLHSEALGDGTHHSRLSLWSWTANQLALVDGSPWQRKNHLGGWGGFVKLEKNPKDFKYFCSGYYGIWALAGRVERHGVGFGVGRGDLLLLWALRKSCLLLG